MNTTRAFSLSKSDLDALNAIESNRSKALTSAFKAVNDNPNLILEQLTMRLNDQVPASSQETSRVSVYLPIFVAGGFDELVTRLRLPAESVCRIAVEAFIRQSANPKKASHEPHRPVQHAPEG
jgi:hypothetical protein